MEGQCYLPGLELNQGRVSDLLLPETRISFDPNTEGKGPV